MLSELNGRRGYRTCPRRKDRNIWADLKKPEGKDDETEKKDTKGKYFIVNLRNVSFSKCASLIPILLAHNNASKQNKNMKLIGIDKEALICAANHLPLARE